MMKTCEYVLYYLLEIFFLFFIFSAFEKSLRLEMPTIISKQDTSLLPADTSTGILADLGAVAPQSPSPAGAVLKSPPVS